MCVCACVCVHVGGASACVCVCVCVMCLCVCVCVLPLHPFQSAHTSGALASSVRHHDGTRSASRPATQHSFNKKVLLRERKRHTDHCVLEVGYPPPPGWTWLGYPPPPSWTWPGYPPQGVDRQTPVKTVPYRRTTYAVGNYTTMFLPPTYEVQGKVMFSLCSSTGGGRVGRGYTGQDQDRVPPVPPWPDWDRVHPHPHSFPCPIPPG